MALVILVPAMAFSWAGLNMLVDRERDARIRSVQETARAAAITIDREIAAAKASLRVFANSQLLEKGGFEDLHALMTASNRSPTSWTVLSDTEGQPLVNTFIPFGVPLPKIEGQWVDRVFKSPEGSVSGYFWGALAQQPAISVDIPVMLGPQKNYVLSQVFYASHFNKAFSSPNIKPSWAMGIFGGDGIAIARNDKSAQVIGKPVRPELHQASLEKYGGVIRFVGSAGIPLYGIFIHTDLTDWTIAIGVPVDEIDGSARNAALFYAVALALTFAFAILAATLLGRKLSTSLRHAAEAADALGKGKAIEPRKSKVEEIDVLQFSLYKTGQDLIEAQASRQRLEQERESLLQSEKQARKVAEMQNKAKDEFLAMLGHEIRNPLAAISGAMTIMDVQGASPEQIRRAKEVGSRQLKQLSHIVDDLLDISRVLAGKIQLKIQVMDLAELVKSCAESRASLDNGQHQWNIKTRRAWVSADPTRLEQIVSNVLENAVKYTPAGGSITIDVGEEAGHAVVTVSDTGIGIDPDLLPRVFDVFVQGTVTMDRKQGGLGIGLALVRQLMEMHGGSVEAKSWGSGQGSTIVLWLPLINPPERSAVLNEADAVCLPKRILLVEDSDDGREMLSTMLQLHGHHVSAACDGEQALSLADAGKFEIAVIDVGLPDINGYEVAKRLQANPATREIKLIALTGYGLKEDKEAARRAGFALHLTKPYTYDKLMECFRLL